MRKIISALSNPWRLLQAQLRQRRFRFVANLLAKLPTPLELLDVGGTPEFWHTVNYQQPGVTLTLYNLECIDNAPAHIHTIVGDACNMDTFQDKQYPVVFSNSVIEHVGDYQQQQRMALEIQRVGQHYCVQTPNRLFPIEPHVLLPFFQFWPHQLQVFFLTHFRSPWGWKLTGKEEAEAYVQAIRLLTEKELLALFPGAQLYKEKFLWLTKSFTVFKGW